MSLAPAFGQPALPPPPSAPEAPAASGRRTVVIAVAAGVVALGVLGGAAALVLSEGDGVESAAIPPAGVNAGPSVEPSALPSVSAPLPTAVTQGRNVFVPLVPAAGQADAPESDAAQPEIGSSAATALPTTESTLTGGAGSSSQALDVATAADQRIRELQSQIASLTQQLVVAGGSDAALRQEVTQLQSEYDTLLSQNADLISQREKTAAELRQLRVVDFVAVDTTTPAQTLDVTVNDQPRRLDLNPATTDVTPELLLGRTTAGLDVVLRYIQTDGTQAPPTVTVQVGSSIYRVSIGGSLAFTVL